MLELPKQIDWGRWVERWDRMQERYLVARSERFEHIVRLIEATQDHVGRIVDLGCGTGSLILKLLEAFPHAQVVGVDLDPTLLPLASWRCAGYGDRVRFVEADLRLSTWPDALPGSCQAAVSVTALHWLSQEQLGRLYGQLAKVLTPGGVFLNADHVGSSCPDIQQAWEGRRQQMTASACAQGEDWASFWAAYLKELGDQAKSCREQALGPWEGIEEGLPLAWHMDALRSVGFACVDCFWRCDGDAIYGGLVHGDGR